MMRTASKVVTEVVPPILATNTNRPYASYIVGKHNSSQDDSKVQHPTIVKTECEAEGCNTTNCAKDISNCDMDTQTSSLVGHLSHNVPEENKTKNTTVELQDVTGSRASAIGVLYGKKEELDIKEVYDGFNFKNSKEIQSDENTYALNEATKNLKENYEKPSNNENDEDKQNK